MSTLHTVNKSPFAVNTLASCLDACSSDDAILLLEDGVFGAINPSPCANSLAQCMARGVKVYALASDLKARGLDQRLHQQIEVTDYPGFVALSLDYRCVQSWY